MVFSAIAGTALAGTVIVSTTASIVGITMVFTVGLMGLFDDIDNDNDNDNDNYDNDNDNYDNDNNGNGNGIGNNYDTVGITGTPPPPYKVEQT